MFHEIVTTKLSEHLTFKNGKKSPSREGNGSFNVFGSNGQIGKAHETNSTQNTIVIGRVGTYCGSVHFSKDECWVTDNAIACVPKNDEPAEFWFYVLEHINLNQFRSGSGQPLLNQSILNSIQCTIPSSVEHRAVVGHYLRTLDNKITLNRQINQTLEQMAQALFKSWFVDFDPVVDNALDAGFFEQNSDLPEELLRRAEQRKAVRQRPDFKPLPAETRLLFPAAFEECEEPSLGLGGWVPKGWERSTYGIHMNFQNGFAFKSDDLIKSEEHSYPVFKMGHIKRGGGFNPQGTKSFFPKKNVNDKIEKFFTKKGDLLMSMTDMKSNMAILGNTALMPVSDVFIQNQRVARLRVSKNSHLDYPYLYFYSNDIRVVEELRSRANSGVQVNLTSSAIKDTLLLVPSAKVHSCFNTQAKVFLEKCFSLDAESASLTNLRDTLLPKLISGELRLNDDGTLASGNTDC